ncbi:putative ribonuclease H-like domain-containing protein [Tanacetum coccineum]
MKDKFQMSSMGELTFFLGLQVQQKEDGIFISQDKYVAEILKKFNYSDVKSALTPVDLEKPLVKDGDVDDVDVHLYRSMIGPLMYLTTSRPDIMFVVCACARFQVTPKTSHLLAVKRIFRYLKGKPTLGLWYSKDSPFELCKKQTVVATSTTEVEDVAAPSCCEQATAKVHTVNEVRQLQDLVDKKRVIVMESSIRRDLHLDDAEVSENLGEDSDHPTNSTQIPIIDQPSLSSQPKKKQPSKKAQRQEAEVSEDEPEHEESVPTPSNDPQPSAKEIVALKKRIQRLERKKMSRPTGLKRLKKVGMSRRVESSKDQESLGAPEDASKQGRILDDDEMHVEAKVYGKDKQSTKPDDSTAGEAVTTASVVPTTIEEITLAQTLIQIKVAKPKVVTTAATTTTTTRPKARGVVVQEPSEFRVPQETQPLSSKDKGKGIIIEPEVPLKRKDQIALDEQIARDIQDKLDVELIEEQKLARKQ